MKFLFFVITLLFICNFVDAQSPEGYLEDVIRKAKSRGSVNSTEVTGSLYNYFYTRVSGSHFWGEDRWYDGLIYTLDGNKIEGSFKYDIYNDLLIVRKQTKSGMRYVSFVPERMHSFNLENHKFVRKRIDNETVGFYKLLVKGRNDLFVDYQKEILETTANPYGEFRDSRVYILEIDDRYVFIKRKKHLFDAYPGLKKQIKSYAKKNDLDLRTLDEYTMQSIVTYMNQ